MALTKMTDDLNIIKKLDNEPNDVGGLTPEVLKSTFDKGPKKIKDYINDTLIPETEDKFEELEGEGRTTETIKKNADNIDKNENDIDDLQANKADKKTTYTKLEIDGLNSDLQHSIENNENNISKLNNDKADKSNTYTKKEIDDKDTTLQGKIKSNEDNISSLKNGKADKSNTYTKGEVDSKNQDLQNKIGKNITDITSLKNNKADKSKVNQNSTNISNHIKSSNAHTANKISYSGKVLNTNNVSGALDTLQEDVNNFASGGTIEEVIHSRKDVDGHTHKNLKTHLDTWESKIKDNEKNLNESKEFRVNPTNSNASVISYPDNTKGLYYPEIKGIPLLFNHIVNSELIHLEKGVVKINLPEVLLNKSVTLVISIIKNNNSAIIQTAQANTDGTNMIFFGIENKSGLWKQNVNFNSGQQLWIGIGTDSPSGATVDFKLYGLYEGDQTNNHSVDIERSYGLVTPSLNYDFVSRGKNLFKDVFEKDGGGASFVLPVFNRNTQRDLIDKYPIYTPFKLSDGYLAFKIPAIKGEVYTFSTNRNTEYYSGLHDVIVGRTVSNNVGYWMGRTTAKTNYILFVTIHVYKKDLALIQIEKSNQVTSYKPYIETKTGFSVPRPLLKIGDLQDDILNNGNLAYRISAVKVLEESDFIGIGINKQVQYISVSKETLKNIMYETRGSTLSTSLTNPVLSGDNTKDTYVHYMNPTNWIMTFPLGTFSDITDARQKLTGTKIWYQLAQPEIIRNGEQGYQAPSPLPSYQNGDLVQIPTSIREVDLNNTKNIIMKDKCIEILELIDSDGNSINGSLGEDGITVTLENNYTGVVYCKCRRDPSTCLNIIPNGLIPGNVNKRVEQNTLGITDLNKDFDKEEKINDMVLLEHELAIGEQGTRLDNAENKVNKHEKQLINMNHTIENQINNTIPEIRTKNAAIRIETRTSDPSNPEIGRIWLRTDL